MANDVQPAGPRRSSPPGNRFRSTPLREGRRKSNHIERASRRLDPHPDPGAALNALARLVRQKRRRGYQDRAA